MKALTKTLVLLTALAGLWLLWQQFQVRTPQKNTQANTVTLKQPTQPTEKNEPNKSTNQLIEPVQKQFSSKQQLATEADNQQAMSYMALYRLSRQWRTCNRINDYQNKDQWFDAAHYIKTQRHRYDKDHTHEPPSIQIDALQRHAEGCLDLQQKFAQMDLPPPNLKSSFHLSEPHLTTMQLMQLLKTYKTKTEQEAALAHAIKLSHEWVELFNLVLAASSGSDSKNSTAIQTIKNELKELRLRQLDILRQSKVDQGNEQVSNAFVENYLAIEQKERAIQGLMVVDQGKRTQAIADFNQVNDQMFALLRSKNPNVFYEAQVTLEQLRTLSYYGFFPHKSYGMREVKLPFSEYVFPEEVIMQAIGLNNSDWFGLLIPYATQLYVCELGADCGPDSEWIKHHCLQLYEEAKAVSCDLELSTFYQQHLLSQNQYQDVQAVVDTIRELYAN